MKSHAENLAALNQTITDETAEVARLLAPFNVRIEAAIKERELVLQAGMAELTGLKVGDRYVSDRIEYEVEFFLRGGWGLRFGEMPTLPTDVENVVVRSRRILKDGTLGNSNTCTPAKYVIAAVAAFKPRQA